MIRDKWMLLLLVQLAVTVTLCLTELWSMPRESFRGVLFAVLIVIIVALMLHRVQSRHKMIVHINALKRAINGNLNTRLLANDEPGINEFVFSINELIEQLDKLQVRTIQSEAARKRLLSNISHDIRTPLTSIIGYLDALQDNIGVSNEEKRQYLDIISRKAGMLKQLIDDLFQLAKLDADEMVMKPETLDLAEIAREAVIEFLPELNRYDIELKAMIPEEACWIVADRLSLHRILNNIIKNAVQYGKKGQQLGIELTETAAGASYQLIIWDKGPGIAEEDLPHIFDRMYRADRSRTSQHGGSGLGLAIAKALVDKHGGSLWAESIPGQRTTFGFMMTKQPSPFKK